jgi:hypothetical protein
MTAAAVPTARSLPRFGRLSTIGVLYGAVGVLIVAYIAPNLEPADKSFTFEPPPEPASISFDPRALAVAIGIFFVITAVATLLPARYEGYARASVLVSTILFAPLVLIVALALSTSDSTNVGLLRG